MSVSKTGRHLIFLISQPRAGSTLLQRMLRNHPDIHTTAEPWTMLPSVYGLREKGHTAEYNAKSAWLAVDGFIRELPQQRATYLEGIRLMHSHLYNAVLQGTGKTYFLDKTPRYYHIIPELIEIFPDARFIFLLRNPLAVACSVMDTWIKGKWFKFHKYRADLLDAPRRLAEGIDVLGDRAITVHYERLLSDPEGELKTITQCIGIEYRPNLSYYSAPSPPQSTSLSTRPGFGYKDQHHIFYQGKLDASNINKWRGHLQDAQKWRILNEYYQALGDETLRALGTDPKSIQALLSSYKPAPIRRALTVSLFWATQDPAQRKTVPYEQYCIKGIRLFQRHGCIGGLIRSIRKLLARLPLTGAAFPKGSLSPHTHVQK